jgi:hypothetical protein
MEAVDKWMGKRALPKSLRQRIGQHYQEVRLRMHVHKLVQFAHRSVFAHPTLTNMRMSLK